MLRAAGAWQLRGEGLRALARICPKLRHLGVRAAFAMSRQEFADRSAAPLHQISRRALIVTTTRR
jgi:hypothetical protein